MKILVLTSMHPIDDVRVRTKIVNGFTSRGHSVTWCGPDRYFFDRSTTSEVEWRLTPHRPGIIGRLTALGRSFIAASRVRDADWIYSPDPDSAAAALILAKLIGAQTLFDIHEEYHDGMIRRGITNPLVSKALSQLVLLGMRGICRATTMTISVNDTIRHTYAAQTAGSNGRTRSLTVLNTAPRSFALEEALGARDRENPPLFMHGKGAAANGTEVVLDALTLIPEADRPPVVIFKRSTETSPPFDPALESSIEERGIASSIRLMTGVPHAEMPRILGKCGVGLIAYGRALGAASLPNRLFEYMAAGLAIIAPNYSPEICAIIDKYGCGLVADFENAEDVANKIQALARDAAAQERYGAAGQRAFLENFAWEVQLDRLLSAMVKPG